MNEEEELVEEIPSEEEDKEAGVPIYKIVAYPSDPTLEVVNDKINIGHGIPAEMGVDSRAG
jgi:hypothetical protein